MISEQLQTELIADQTIVNRVYPAYKDSGVEWLGEIPAHWEVISIKRVLLIPITDGPHVTPQLLDEGIPFISAEAIKNGKIDFDKKRGYISEKDHNLFSKKYSPKKGDVYMVKSGATTGNVAVVETDSDFSIWSPLAVFRSNPQKVLPEYIHLFLQSTSFKKSVELNWSFGTQQNIGMGILSNLPLVLPPLAEQTRIAEFLDQKTAQIDQAIAQKERLIELLNERRQVMIHRAVTRGLNPDVPMKDSGIDWIGEIPAHWEVKKLKHVFKSVDYGLSESGADEGDFKYLNMGHIQDGKVIVENTNFLSKAPSELLLQDNDILFNRTNSFELVGKSGIYKSNQNEKVTFASYLVRLKANRNTNPNWLNFLLLNSRFLEFIRTLALRSINQANLNPNRLRAVHAAIPPKEEQDLIAIYLEEKSREFDLVKARIQSQIEKLQELKSTLINSTVTGKIKV